MMLPLLTTAAGFAAALLSLLLLAVYPGSYPLHSNGVFFVVEFSVAFGYLMGLVMQKVEHR